MRKAFLTIGLVAAAFAGGAAANGPALDWLRALLAAPGMVETPASALADAGPSAGPAEAPPRPTGREPGDPSDEVPAARTPPSTPPEPAAPATPGPARAPAVAAPATPGGAAEAPRAPDPSALRPAAAPASAVAGLSPGLAATGPSPRPAPADAAPPPVVPAPALPEPADPSAAAPPADGPDPAVVRAGGGPAPAGDWAEARARLADAGVTRYRIEGEPGGKVRLSCLVPVPGQRSVSQHFEAEADDEARAAEAVLRRVALWKATEEPAP